MGVESDDSNLVVADRRNGIYVAGGHLLSQQVQVEARRVLA